MRPVYKVSDDGYERGSARPLADRIACARPPDWP